MSEMIIGAFNQGKGNALLLDLDLRLFQLIDLLTDHLHLLELTGHCMICQLDNISANVGTHGAAVIEGGGDEVAAACIKRIGQEEAQGANGLSIKKGVTMCQRGQVTYTDAQIRRCFATDSQTPGAVDPATPSDGSWERAPCRDERCTWWNIFFFASCFSEVTEGDKSDARIAALGQQMRSQPRF